MIKFNRYYNQKLVFGVVIIAFLSSLFGMAFADPSPTGIVKTGIAAIIGKTHSSILVGEGQCMVTPATMIMDENDNQIQLIQLPIPCQAEIQYQLRMDEAPLCLKIKVTGRL